MASRVARFLWGSPKTPLVNVVRLQGVIAASTSRGPAARRLINLDRVEKWFVRAFSKSLKPRAVAISINSPGGSPVQSELIHNLVRSLREESGIPVYTFAEDVAASGGYWLMCSGDRGRVYASKTSIVGSIGVITSQFGFVDAIKKLGIERRVYTAGISKSMLDPFKPVSEEQERTLRGLLEGMHFSFKELVHTSRGDALKVNDEDLFSGRVWTGAQAAELGIVDGCGDIKTTLRAEFGPDTRFNVCSTLPGGGLLSGLFSERGGGRFAGLLPPFGRRSGGGGSGWSSEGAPPLGASAGAAFGEGDGGGEGGLLRAAAEALVGAGGMAAGDPRVLAQQGMEGLLDEVEYRAAWSPYMLR